MAHPPMATASSKRPLHQVLLRQDMVAQQAAAAALAGHHAHPVHAPRCALSGKSPLFLM